MHPFVWGTTAVLVLWAAPAVVTWTFDPVRLFRGGDGRPSASQLQFLICVAFLLFSYVSGFAALAAEGRWLAGVVVPPGLVAALGTSALTAVSAKIITSAQLVRGRISKRFHPTSSLAFLILEDDGRIDLGRVALLAWTMVAAVVQLIRLWCLLDDLPAGPLSLPSMDDGVVGLLALAQVAYLGGKLVSFDQPRLTGLAPASGRGPLPMTITGRGLGWGEGALITVDGMPIAVFVGSWTNERIELTLPGTRPDGTPWPRDRPVNIGLISEGRNTLNALPFTFA